MIKEGRQQRAKERQMGRVGEEASMRGPWWPGKKKRELALAMFYNGPQIDTEKEIVFGHAIDLMYLGHISIMFMAFCNLLPLLKVTLSDLPMFLGIDGHQWCLMCVCISNYMCSIYSLQLICGGKKNLKI